MKTIKSKVLRNRHILGDVIMQEPKDPLSTSNIFAKIMFSLFRPTFTMSPDRTAQIVVGWEFG